MAKQSGLGDLFCIGGVDVSGDVGVIDRINGGPSVEEVPGIDVSAQERIGLVRDGGAAWSSYFNPDRAHPTLSALPTAAVGVTYGRGRSLGSPGAMLVGRQLNYDGSRAANGSLRFAVEVQADGYGLDWGRQLTAGYRTDTEATDGASVDHTDAETEFGWQAMLHVTALTGTNVVVTLQDSADDSSFDNLTGGAFTSVTSAPAWERLEGGRTATVRRYVRAVTSGTFTSATFLVVFTRNTVAVTF